MFLEGIYPQNFKSHKEMLVFVHHMMSVQHTYFNKGMQILGKSKFSIPQSMTKRAGRPSSTGNSSGQGHDTLVRA